MITSAPAEAPLLTELVPGRVAVFRALRLGDMLCAIPAFRALRAALPRAVITLIGLPWAKELVRRYPAYFDSFLSFPGYPGFAEQPFSPPDLIAFLDSAREKCFDLVIQMQGDGSLANELIDELGAAVTAGFYPKWEPCPDDRAFLAYPEDELEPRRHLMLMEFLGASAQGEQLEFPIYPGDTKEAMGLLEEEGIAGNPYVCLHVGGISGGRWPADRFARVAAGLVRLGLRVVLSGVAEERHLAGSVLNGAVAAVNLCGRTSLGGFGALVSGARLLVCNDTGVSHLAAALAVPSVVITRSDGDRWAPMDRKRHTVLLDQDKSDLSPDCVLDEATRLLERYATNCILAVR